MPFFIYFFKIELMSIGIIAKEGYKFFIYFIVLSTIFLSMSVYLPCSSIIICNINKVLSFVFCFLAFFSLLFFRNPKRKTPEDSKFVISPADGKIVQIKKIDNDYTGNESTIVSVFMSVFNVHINKNPISGIVEKIEYSKGSFMNAAFEEASLKNEQNRVYINGDIKLVVVQIAGLIARRIKCFLKVNDNIKKGDYLGLIQFGSRLDITMPKNVIINVKIGDKVKAGYSILGEISNK